jgi:hypothetical protein
VTESTWRPLGVDTEDLIAEYDALHEGVPDWMASVFWDWIRATMTVRRTYRDGSGSFPMVREALVEEMCQRLRIGLPPIRMTERGESEGQRSSRSQSRRSSRVVNRLSSLTTFLLTPKSPTGRRSTPC